MTSAPPYVEPAIRSYFFGKGYRDLRDTIRECWERNKQSADDYFARKASEASDASLFVKGFWISAGLSIYIFGTAFFIAISLVHASVLGLLFLLIYVGFTVLWLTERGVFAARSFFMACPHCHEHSVLPEYHCDNCSEVHARLWPNSYGILFHLCTCGVKLPATFFLNRGRLRARCPRCRLPIEREHVESKRLFIAVMGGPSAGKSAFLFDGVRQLVEHEAAALGYETDFFDRASESAYNDALSRTRQGQRPYKTGDHVPRAFHLALRKDARLMWLLYLYDPSGEAFNDANTLTQHSFHNFLSGMVLIVDPFALLKVQQIYATDLARDSVSLQPSEPRIEDMLDRLLLTLESQFNVPTNSRAQTPLAVVISKVDAFDLERVIGEPALDRAISARPPTERVDRDAMRNTLLKSTLAKWGEQGFVQRVDARFQTVRYFTCSALGRMPDASGKAFTGHGVLPPLLWLFEQAGGPRRQ